VLCSASIYGEGLSNTLAEGLLCGCVCVASRVGDAAILVADPGRLFDAGDVDAMTDRILAAIPAAGADRSGGRARIEELCSIERLVRETEAFFRRVLAQHAPV
jgi:glycosyltransferase involved in cell wall biosynthesis